MNEFIQLAVSKLGLSEDSASSATGGLLQLIKSQVGGTDADQLLQNFPGSQELLAKASGGASGGGLGGLVSSVSSMFGGKLGAVAGLAGTLGSAGLSADKFGPFASLFVDFIKNKAGADLVDRVMEQLPELKKILG